MQRIALDRNEADEVVEALGPQFGEVQQICGRDQAWLAAGGGALWFVCTGASDIADASRIDLLTDDAQSMTRLSARRRPP